MNGDNSKVLDGLKVLIVEDNEVNQKVIQAMLQHYSVKTDVAENGEEALEKLKEKSYDLIIMDCQMPVMDGFETSAAIRNINDNDETYQTKSNVIIVAVTANASESDIDKCYEYGMNDFLPKPVELDVIGRMLEKWHGNA